MTKLLQSASTSFNLSKTNLSFRGRRDDAYVEFMIADEIIRNQVPRNPEYPQMVSSTSQNNQLYKTLQKSLGPSQDQFQNIRKIIIQENQRNGLMPLSGMLNGSNSSGSRPQSPSSGVFSAESLGHSPRLSIDSTVAASPKQKPPVRPKPESLHGTAINDLNARFAALRNPTPTTPNGTAVLKMPDPADFQPQRKPLNSQMGPPSLPAPRLTGPRDMPINKNTTPSLPPKIPLDTNLPPSILRPPSPMYSPARNMQTPAGVDPPRATARSMVGTGGRSNSYAASVASSRPPGSDYELGSYFPSSSSHLNGDSRRKGVIGLPTETIITADRLFDFLKLYDILLIDLRNRQDFDDGHIESNTILCVEPLQLRPGISAADIQNSLSISPDEEDALFEKRDQFDLIVYYDQSTKTTQFLSSISTDEDEKLRIFHEALVDYNIDKPLKNPPVLLAGGIDAWVELLGRPSLQTSRTQIGKPRRKLSVLPSPLVVGRKRVRQFNPLNADEEREWSERARSESVNIPDVPDELVEEADEDLPFYRTEADFLRRYPDVQVQPESMIAPPPRDSSLPQQLQAPYPRPQSQPSRPPPIDKDELLTYSQPDMPSRPAPTAPRVSYSGAHDRNTAPPFNAMRSRYLPPTYISPQEKPANVLLPRTGLVNFGTTCYMNSIIQCLSATVPLSRYFKDGSYKKFVQRDNWKGSRGVLPDLYGTLIHNLWLKVSDPDSIRPVTFRVSQIYIRRFNSF
jgi:ubiquitin carboxyl-terminal hydrolase 8